MKADLHFHPSFFSYGDKPHITEWNYPTLNKIILNAYEKEIDVLTITSCSSKNSIDKRWDNYMKDLMGYDNIKNYARFDCYFDNKPRFIYFFHGQEFKTDKGDLNILFAEQRVPIEKSNGKFEYVVDSARDSGENVLIGINQVGKSKLRKEEIKGLYDTGKIDFIESYNSMDLKKNNDCAGLIAKETGIPGIVVSDGHRLEDLGKSYIKFSSESNIKSPKNLGKLVKEKIRKNDFFNVENPLPLSSKILYMSRLINARFFPNL